MVLRRTVPAGDETAQQNPGECTGLSPHCLGKLVRARSFATDTDHYDFRSSRCVKDLTLRALRDTGEEEMEVEFQHNCWKHDQDLLIRHSGVSSLIVDPADEDRGTDLGAVIRRNPAVRGRLQSRDRLLGRHTHHCLPRPPGDLD
ncbi:hypothetical protein [Streptomyces griseoaurantiacus]|uniref:hypothetical protein n=1 Tax=Streptomyces griseoaurantiacus TaxID=68213 RepID=UPI003248428A